jgi:alkylation response protein AidB-like acyl-CoA dehydrogenase
MDFSLSDREQELIDAFGKFFNQESPIATVRAAEPGGFDPKLWAATVDLGVPAMALPDADGGATFVELALLCELAGRALAPIPLIETLCCVRALSAARATVTQETAAVDAAIDELTSGGAGAVALRSAAERRHRQLVPGAAVADIVLMVTEDDAVVLARPGDGDRRLHRFEQVHGSAPVAAWDLERGDADTTLQASGGAAWLADVRVEWKVLTAAALMGLARRALEIGAEYATGRRAFGTPIGTFQGVAHPLADAAAEIDGGTLLVRRAAWLIAEGRTEDASHLARLAWGFCGPAAMNTTARSVHIHGGYGAALEYDIQLFHTRARAWATMLGDPHEDLRAVGDGLLAAATGAEDVR